MSVLTGRLVTLRPVETADVAALHGMLNKPLLSGRRWLPDGYSDELPLSTVDVGAIVDRWIEKREADPHYVLTRAASAGGAVTDGEAIIGHAVMGWSWDPLTPWVGVVIDPDHWRNGFGSEALQLMLGYLFGSTPALNVAAWINDWDAAANAFATAHGFRKTGRVRHVGLRNGMPYDQITYDLLRSEWRESTKHGAEPVARQGREQHGEPVGTPDQVRAASHVDGEEREPVDAS